MSVALHDLREGLRLVPVALHFAWGDTRARYRRSVLGPFWLVGGTAVAVAGLGYLWSAILGVDTADYQPSLAIGLVIWQMLSGGIMDGRGILVRDASVIRNIRMPVTFFCLQSLLRHLINFAHNAVVIAVVLAMSRPGWSPVQALVVPGLLLISVNLLWIMVLLGMFGARYRDLDPLIAAVMPILFFLSPVIFRTDQAPVHPLVIWLNPLSHFITAMRSPLLGEWPPLFVYAVLTGLAVAGWLVTLAVLERRAARVAFWL